MLANFTKQTNSLLANVIKVWPVFKKMKYVSQKERFEHLQQFKFDSRMINEGFVISNELKCLKKKDFIILR